MDRRESMKSLLIGTMAGGVLLQGCAPESADTSAMPVSKPEDKGKYGRTIEEKARDEKLLGSQGFSETELATIAILCDLILPSTDSAGGALDASVPEFIDFIAKDIPSHELPIKGGLMWLESRSNNTFGLPFVKLTDVQRKSLLDEIAYSETAAPEVSPGVAFFSRMRNLTLTGYYTTKMGIEDLGYKGNQPNVWDGVPQEVLDEHGMAYDKAWLAKCVDQSKREDIAEWDDQGNLLT
ncbi:MAG: gluconate 2-dehydrogenase subunit 3 family protein [Cyclobacteriaceae bacterium]